MKTLITLVLISLAFHSFGLEEHSTSPHVATVEKSEIKEFLLEYYEDTHDQLLAEVSGLNEEQMHYKASADSWSVSQNLEHIILTEKAIFSMIQGLLEKPATPERRGEVGASDQEIIDQITNRSFKAQASEDLQPEGMYDNPEEAIAEFESQRSVILDFIETSTLDFRNYIFDSPFGAVDAYQNFLFLAGHTNRHTLQIEEVIASEGFPE